MLHLAETTCYYYMVQNGHTMLSSPNGDIPLSEAHLLLGLWIFPPLNTSYKTPFVV